MSKGLKADVYLHLYIIKEVKDKNEENNNIVFCGRAAIN
jgi:hypothetical protein